MTPVTKGRGVFCIRLISKRARYSKLRRRSFSMKRPQNTSIIPSLANYIFKIGGISKALRKHHHIKQIKDCSGVIMGLISFCNHSDDPNAEVEWEEHNGTLYHQVRALRLIPKNTEICTTYGGGWFEDRK